MNPSAGDISASSDGERVCFFRIQNELFEVRVWFEWCSWPDCVSPQIFCVFLFLCAASLFGTIIAQINEIVADLTTKKKDLDKVLEIYLTLTPRLLFAFYKIHQYVGSLCPK